MRGTDETSGSLFSYVDLEARIPARHPLRKIRQVVNEALASLDPEFESLYTDFGRPSIPPERLIRASLIQILFSVRSERQLMEQMQYNLLFRWFVGLNIDDPVWDHSTFSFNRERLFDAQIAQRFFENTVLLARVQELVSDEHFSVDGTLLEAWASHKSFRPKDGTPKDPPGGGHRNAQPDFKGQKRRNDTHESASDPDARLYRKGNTGAQLSYQAHVLMEHRSGLVRAACVTQASGHGERDAALAMLRSLRGRRRRTLAADKGYDTADFVAGCRAMGVTPHVAQNTSNRRSAIDGRTTRHAGYAISLRTRAWIETHFGWLKAAAGLRQVKQRGLAKVEALFQLAMAASNLVRLPKLIAAGAA